MPICWPPLLTRCPGAGGRRRDGVHILQRTRQFRIMNRHEGLDRLTERRTNSRTKKRKTQRAAQNKPRLPQESLHSLFSENSTLFSSIVNPTILISGDSKRKVNHYGPSIGGTTETSRTLHQHLGLSPQPALFQFSVSLHFGVASDIAFAAQASEFSHMFASREDAGRQLASLLRQESVKADLVLGLPRGGVVVAAEVAHGLDLPLDVVVVRKIGHPLQREFAVGALAEPDIVVLDERILARSPHIRPDLNYIIDEERERLADYQRRFHREGFPDLSNKSVIIVDDGLATGATNEAAALSARKQGASRVFVAAPVASTNAVERLSRVADSVYVLYADPEFDAVGRYYDVFNQTSDEEVLDLLRAESRRHA